MLYRRSKIITLTAGQFGSFLYKGLNFITCNFSAALQIEFANPEHIKHSAKNTACNSDQIIQCIGIFR